MLFPVGLITIPGFFGTDKDFEFTFLLASIFHELSVLAVYPLYVKSLVAGNAGSSQIKGKQSHMGSKWVCSVHPQCCNMCVVVGVARGYSGW